jgi:hypothetical protein
MTGHGWKLASALIATVAAVIGAVAGTLAIVDHFSPEPRRSVPSAEPTVATPRSTTTALALDSIYDATRDAGGFDTGIQVKTGDDINIHARGVIVYGNDGEPKDSCFGSAQTDPDGNRAVNGVACSPKIDPNCPAPTVPVGALIGRIGASAWFFIGSNKAFPADRNGNLWLAHNDRTPNDNSGHYEVTIQTS